MAYIHICAFCVWSACACAHSICTHPRNSAEAPTVTNEKDFPPPASSPSAIYRPEINLDSFFFFFATLKHLNIFLYQQEFLCGKRPKNTKEYYTGSFSQSLWFTQQTLYKTFDTQEEFLLIGCQNKVRTGGKMRAQIILSRREDRISKDIYASNRNNLMLPLNHVK